MSDKTFAVIMMTVGGLMFLGSIAWMWRDVRRRNKSNRDRLDALVQEARRVAREGKK